MSIQTRSQTKRKDLEEIERLQQEIETLKSNFVREKVVSSFLRKKNEDLTRQHEYLTKKNEYLTKENEHLTKENEHLTAVNKEFHHTIRANGFWTHEQKYLNQNQPRLGNPEPEPVCP
jgi:hypothetical protein